MVIDQHMRHDWVGGEFGAHSVLKTLHELGYSTTLLAADLVRAEPHTRQLQQLGIEVLYGVLSLSRFGQYLDAVIVSGPELAQRYLPLIRRYAPQASLYYNSVDDQHTRELRREEIKINEDVLTEASRLRATELEAARACDGTIVMGHAEKVTLEEEISGVKVHVVSDAGVSYSPDLVKQCIERGNR